MKTSKYIIITVAAIVLMASFAVHGQELPSIPQITKPISQMTIPEIKAKIAEIIAVVQQLQALLAKLQPGISGIPGGYAFNTNLKYGTSSQDVKYLQIILNQDPAIQVSSTGPGSPGQESMYFGQKTLNAVIKFQAKYNIQATGYVGPMTRTKLNELLGQPSTPTTPSTPSTPTTPTATGGMCGDNIIQTPNSKGIYEICDTTQLGNQSCQTRGYTGGILSCASNCITFNTINCTSGQGGAGGTPTPSTPTPTTSCGDNIIQSPNTKGINEVCDGTKLNNQTCITKGYTSGTLKCSSNCLTFDTSTCISATPPTNHAPVLNPIGNKSVNENQLLTFTISATDQDNDTLTYSAQTIPSGASFNSTTKTFTWTPSYTQQGTYNVTFTVSDSKLTDTETITITVNNVIPPISCGDGTCNGTETCSTCPSDCGICVTGTYYYVDPDDGNDNNAGTIEKPFKTIEKARDTIRARNIDGVTVYLREGTFYLTQPLTFDQRDSGSAGASNTYRSYPGEEVTISGGKVLDSTNYPWDTYNHNGHLIYKTNVGDLRFNSLFVDDKRATRAREPDEHYYNDTDYYIMQSVDPATNFKAFNFSGNDIDSSWYDLNNVEVLSFKAFTQPRFRIDRVEGNKVYFQGTPRYPYDWNWWWGSYGTRRYYVENVFEGLDEPGEWYLNNQTGDLYYWSLDGQNPQNSEIVVPVLEKLLNVQGTSTNYAEKININGIIFAHTDWHLPDEGYRGDQNAWRLEDSPNGVGPAISFVFTNNCAFTNNTIIHTGANALRSYSENLRIIGNEITDIGANAIKLGVWDDNHASDSAYYGVAKNNIITDNKIHDVGKVYKEGAGIFVMISGNNLISHNLIYNISASGIAVGWGWTNAVTALGKNIISYNDVSEVMQYMRDGAAVYTLSRQDGTVIEYNKLHDILPSPRVRDAYGVYLDEGSTNIIVRYNWIYRGEGDLVFNGSTTQFNTIENNVFTSTAWYMLDYGSSGSNNVFNKNIVYNTLAPALFGVSDYSTFDQISASDYNLYYNVPSWNQQSWNSQISSWKTTTGFDANSIEYDPLFINYSVDNFNLQPNSPALLAQGAGGIGFQQIDMSGVGPRTSSTCSGTDTSCGTYPSCNNCNNQDACLGTEYRNYFCSSNTCIYTPDSCTDCSCSCGGYNVTESLASNNCSDSKDNDCDGLIDSNDPGCQTPSLVPQDYISYWKFENNANDEKGVNNGTIYGNPQFVTGVQGQALSFDGTADYVSVSDSLNDMDNVTISFWLRMAGDNWNNGFANMLVTSDRFGWPGTLTIWEDNRVYFRLYDNIGDTFRQMSSKVMTGATGWHHLTVIFSKIAPVSGSYYMDMYIDGSNAGNSYFNADGAWVAEADTNFRIGAESNDGNSLNGTIDEVMFFNRALSAAEIQNIYNSQKPAGMAKAESKELDLKGLASILSSIQSILEKLKSLF